MAVTRRCTGIEWTVVVEHWRGTRIVSEVEGAGWAHYSTCEDRFVMHDGLFLGPYGYKYMYSSLSILMYVYVLQLSRANTLDPFDIASYCRKVLISVSGD